MIHRFIVMFAVMCSSFFIPHSSFLIINASFLIPHSSYLVEGGDVNVVDHMVGHFMGTAFTIPRGARGDKRGQEGDKRGARA